MRKALLSFLIFTSALNLALEPLLAQPAPTDQDLTLRPGDRLSWSPSAPHRVQFGGTPGGITLTPYSNVQKVLDISPPLTTDPQRIARAAPGATVNATVKADAATSGVAAFNFTCGTHPAQMITMSFKIAPASSGQQPRNVEVITANPLRWILKTDHGDLDLNASR
jgi:hypothetical protein